MTQAGGTSYTYDDNGNLTDRGTTPSAMITKTVWWSL
jgi:hypothetical protein